MLKKFSFMMWGGLTKRFHTVPTIREHTVGHHAYGVACIAYLLTEGEITTSMLMTALTHDCAEHITGDLPSPLKRALPGVGEVLRAYETDLLCDAGLKSQLTVTDKEKRTLKLADIFEGMHSCIVERGLGNRLIETAYRNFAGYAEQLNPVGKELELMEHLMKLWSKAND